MAKAAIEFEVEDVAKNHVLDGLCPWFRLNTDETATALTEASFLRFDEAKKIRVKIEVETIDC